jgi:hypothetical protein
MAEQRTKKRRGRGRRPKYEDHYPNCYLSYQNEDRPTMGFYDLHGRRQQQNVLLAEHAVNHFDGLANGPVSGLSDFQRNVILELLDEVPANRWRVTQRVLTELGRLIWMERPDMALEGLTWAYRYRGTPGTRLAKMLRHWRNGEIDELPGQ